MSDVVVILSVAFVIGLIVVGTIGLWYFQDVFFRTPSDTYADWIAYQAEYEGALDLDNIEASLIKNNITYIRKTETDWTGSHEVIICDYGPYFNDANVSNTQCRIYSIHEHYPQLFIQIYGADSRYGDLKSFKPAYQESMNYITNIIFDGTGKHPIHFEYFYEDGSPLSLPP